MLIYSWGNITHAHAHAHTHTHIQTPSFWLKFSEIVYAPQKKKNQYCLFILHLSLANMGNHKKKNYITKNDAPRQQKKVCSKREGPTTFLPPRHIFSWFKGNERARGRALHVCCHAGRWEKKWKDLRELGRIWKGTCTAMGGKSRNICLLVSKVKNHLKEHLGIKQRPFAAKITSTVYHFFILFPKGSWLKNSHELLTCKRGGYL